MGDLWHSVILQPFQQYCGAYSLGLKSHPILPPSLHGEEGSSFLGLVLPNDTFEFKSVMGIKPGTGGVIGYQVDEFTLTWSVGCFVAQSYIYPGFMGKMSTLTCFPLETRCED